MQFILHIYYRLKYEALRRRAENMQNDLAVSFRQQSDAIRAVNLRAAFYGKRAAAYAPARKAALGRGLAALIPGAKPPQNIIRFNLQLRRAA